MIDNLRTVISALKIGMEITLKSGHIILLSNEHDEPGILMNNQDGDQVILSIGSEDVWSLLIDHARKMTISEHSLLCSNVAFNKVKRNNVFANKKGIT